MRIMQPYGSVPAAPGPGPGGVPRPLSPMQAAGEAVDIVRQRLFPFRFDRWLRLGFVAFLDSFGRGGGSGGGRIPGGAPGSTGSTGSTGAGAGSPEIDHAMAWIAGH